MKNKTGKTKDMMPAQHVAVLLEDMQSQFRAFGEGLRQNNEKLATVEATTARTWETITKIDVRLIRVENKLTNVENKLANVENKLEIVEKDVKEIKAIIQTHGERITRLEAIK